MKQKRKRSGILLAVLTVCVLVFMLIANGIQTDHGNVTITTESFAMEEGTVTYKLYRPKTATAENPAPAVLLLHGYQNDKDTCDAYAIELARRGAVVMAIDEYGHGNTTLGMRSRGAVNHKLSVNYGTEGVQVKEISGTGRYKLLMNLSNLDFFNKYYSQDAQGNAILDSSMGGAAAYALLAELDFVDVFPDTPWVPGLPGPRRRRGRVPRTRWDRTFLPSALFCSAASCSMKRPVTNGIFSSRTCFCCRQSMTNSIISGIIRTRSATPSLPPLCGRNSLAPPMAHGTPPMGIFRMALPAGSSC